MRRNFTLVELLIGVVIIGVIVTIAVPLYHKVIEDANEKVCITNQKVILGALETYALENDRLPGSLSKLRKEDLRRAWAKVLGGKDAWKIKIAYFLVDFGKRGVAYAAEGWIGKYVTDINYLHCPNAAGNSSSAVSYGLNNAVKNKTYSQYCALDENTVVIADSDTPTFDTPVYRHKAYTLTGTRKYAVVTTVKKRNKRRYRTSGSGGGSGRSDQEGEGRGDTTDE